MKLKVVVDDRTFVVEVGSLSERPVVAVVDGERFEVWPESTAGEPEPVLPTESVRTLAPVHGRVAPSPRSPMSAAAAEPSGAIYAPIPGVIEALSVREGDAVVAGQEVCVLEAMKMKNIIRASRAGEIGRIHVSEGQHVKHRDLLVEYAD